MRMADGSSVRGRVRVDGKFFRLGERNYHLKGVTYGPFAPNASGEPFATPEQTKRDFAQIRELGANLLRVYEVPPRWFLDLAQEMGLKLLIDIPWNKHRCFLESEKSRGEARTAVERAVSGGAAHPAIFAWSVVNEIPPDIVRWSGAREVEEFIEELIDLAKATDPDCLCTMGNFPPTEFLRPRNLDFICFNVYLHQRRPLENYLARLQMLAETKPLVLGEFGLDSLREGEAHKSATLAWHIEAAFRGGVAGAIVFSFTDDWHRGGRQIEDWAFGLVTKERVPKQSFFAVQEKFQAAPYFPLTATPRVSVVVACYNGARTLKICLESLTRLNYPDYEVILVDDGSTDATPEIARNFKTVRLIQHRNHGLSVARNTGSLAATGEVIAFTDADCRADEDWLYYVVGDLVTSRFAGMGGHNLLPPDDSPVAAAVMASPGGPAHVMLNDRVAEHIPGCNMVFYKWALETIGGFDPVFRKAGDDVDICWRLQESGLRIGFNPAGFVWHYRRSTVRDYLKQQEGYGEAEALLVRKHPEYFNALGGSLWRGRIYGTTRAGVVSRHPIIYHGVFGTGFFQTLYASPPSFGLMFGTSLEFQVLVTLPLLVLSVPFHFFWPVALLSLLVSPAVCGVAAWQAEIPKTKCLWWSRPLAALLFFLQPLVRGWARYSGRIRLEPLPEAVLERMSQQSEDDDSKLVEERVFWSDGRTDRVALIRAILQRLDAEGWPHKADAGWSEHDVELYGTRWSRLQIATVSEIFSGGQMSLRCRVRSEWSLQAKLAFWGLLGLELLLIGLVGTNSPWIWMLLLTMPIFGWYLEQEKKTLQHLALGFLDEVARQRNLTRLDYSAEADQFTPVSGPPIRPEGSIRVTPLGKAAPIPSAGGAVAATVPQDAPAGPA